MRNLLIVVALVAGGCASVNRGSGASGAAVVSGETRPQAAETGARTDSVATNGSDDTDTPR